MIPRGLRRPRDEDTNEFSLTPESLGLATASELMAQLSSESEESAPEAERYVPRPLKSRRKERKLLGKPCDREDCFLCSFKGERDAVPAPRRDVEEMIDFMRESVGRMKSALLAVIVATQYEQIQKSANSKARPGQVLLPYMSAATVLEHMRKHTQDPEWKMIFMLEELQEIRETLVDQCFDQSTTTKQTRPNRVAFHCLDTVIKLELQLHSKDPSKMLFYSAGARVSQQSMKQGPVSIANKRLYNWMKQRK